MKRSRAVFYGLVAFGLFLSAGYRFAEIREETLAEAKRVERDARTRAFPAEEAARRYQNFEDEAMTNGVPRSYPRPVSHWQQNEKILYEKILSGGKFDVLVVPFQVWGSAVDRATRSVMTAELAALLGQSGKVKVPDPYLVAKALGDGQRQQKPEDIYRIANAIGAKRIVWGYVGHDRKGKMAVAVASRERVANAQGGAWTGPTSTRKFENLAFDDGTPPIEVYESLLPEVAKALDIPVSVPVFQQIEARLEMAVLPPSPINLIAADDNPARNAYTFLLYGMLTPANMERTKERFAEKALLALSRLSPASPEYRALRARTYMALGLRMAAIRVLGVPQTDEEREVLAALNGNLPDVRALADREKNPLKRLLQKLDENQIGAAYGVINAKKSAHEADALKLPGPIWPFIANRAFTGWDAWSQFDNASLKTLLDHELPVKGFFLKDTTQAAVSLGDAGKIQTTVDLSVFNHGQKFLEADSKWCCEFSAHRPVALDYLELLQSMGHDNLVRRINFLTAVQGRPDAAINFANSIDAIYKGNPYYTLERARTERTLAANAGGIEKSALHKSASENAYNAMYWEQGQSHVSSMASDVYLDSDSRLYAYSDNFYHTDIPYRPYYWTWGEGGKAETQIANKMAALGNATWHIHAASEIVGHYNHFYPDDERVNGIFKSIEGRFMGSPRRNTMLSAQALRVGDLKTAETLLRDNISLSPGYWNSYEKLGALLYASGDVDAAAKVFHAYPGFRKDSGESRVGIANDAYTAGSYFYWAGHFDLAEPFYKISASQGTGASSEMTSAIRLKLLAGDTNAAMAGSLARAQRYRESYAYRDYLGLLHASGHSKEAWPAFGTLVNESHQPHIWETALVGHRRGGLSEAEVVAWARQSEFKGAGMARNAPAIYLLRFATTDRTPSKDLAEVIDGMEVPRWRVDGHPGLAREGEQILQTGAKRQRVKSALAYFAQGYRALKLKDFAAAKSIFDEAATFYELTEQQVFQPNLHFLPYYALAAAKTANTSALEKMLGNIKVDDRGFDYHLARAVLAGASGKADEALHSLGLARYCRPNTDGRPLLTQYTYGEISELVFELTGDARAKELAIEWAKKSQKLEPWHSWSYTLEAKLTKNPVDRHRALAMAHYLDPKSERLSEFKKPEIDDAVKAYGRANPFLAKPPVGKSKDVI